MVSAKEEFGNDRPLSMGSDATAVQGGRGYWVNEVTQSYGVCIQLWQFIGTLHHFTRDATL
jgi:hypothetical protein